MSHQPVKKIGKYKILEEIGRGGFAVVYKARDPDLDRVVALKVLAPHLTWDPTFAQRFRREAQATARLRHPHIVTIYEVGEADDQLYIAMEYLPGRTLAQALDAETAIPLEPRLSILEQVADALDYAHGQGVIHRDVKPSNVMVEEGGRGKVRATLMDFGLVKAMRSSESLTSLGTTLGSPEYMAPEQADPDRKDEIGPATDCYALGVVAYKMLTGQVPFPGSTPSTLVAHMQKTPPDPQGIRQDLPENMAQVLLKALSKSLDERYPTAMAMVEALRKTVKTETQEREQARKEELRRLYAEGIRAGRSQDWQAAIAAFQEVVALDSQYQDAATHLAIAKTEERKAEEAREQEAHLAELYDQALEAKRARNWARVISAGEEIRTIDPRYKNVARLLRQAKTEKRKAEQLERCYAEGIRAGRSQDWEAAITAFQEVVALESQYRDAAAHLATAKAEQRKAEKAQKREARLTKLYNQALAAKRARNWAQAISAGEEIRTIDPHYKDVANLLQQARAEKKQEHRLASIYGQITKAQDDQDWDTVITLCEKITATRPDYKNMVDILQKARKARKLKEEEIPQLYQRGVKHMEWARWEAAVAQFERVLELDKGHRDAAAKLKQARQKHISALERILDSSYFGFQAKQERSEAIDALVAYGELAARPLAHSLLGGKSPRLQLTLEPWSSDVAMALKKIGRPAAPAIITEMKKVLGGTGRYLAAVPSPVRALVRGANVLQAIADERDVAALQGLLSAVLTRAKASSTKQPPYLPPDLTSSLQWQPSRYFSTTQSSQQRFNLTLSWNDLALAIQKAIVSAQQREPQATPPRPKPSKRRFKPPIVVDESHKEQTRFDEFSKFKERLEKWGRPTTRYEKPLAVAHLKGKYILIVGGPESPMLIGRGADKWKKEEVEAIQSFVAGGGGLLVMGYNLINEEHLNALTSGFGIYFLLDEVGDITTTDLAEHPLTRGLKEIKLGSVRGGVGRYLQASDSTIVLARGQERPVSVTSEYGLGRVVALASVGAFSNEYLPANARLLDNILAYLYGED